MLSRVLLFFFLVFGVVVILVIFIFGEFFFVMVGFLEGVFRGRVVVFLGKSLVFGFFLVGVFFFDFFGRMLLVLFIFFFG